MKQRGFILIAMLLFSAIISLLALGSLSQSRLEAYFARNVLDKVAMEQELYQNLQQAEIDIARQVPLGPQVHIIGEVPNSLNYFDRGGTDIAQIMVKVRSLILEAIWWQRRPDQFNVPKIQRFLAKDGKFYQLVIHCKPLGLDFGEKEILLPKTVTQIGQALLVDTAQLGYADQLYLMDNQAQLYSIDLTSHPSQWRLAKLARLSASPLLTIPLWASFSAEDELELYIASKQGIEAWQVSDKVKPLWKARISHLVSFFLEGKRLWYVKKSTSDKFSIAALNRLTGEALLLPEQEFSPHNTDYNWRLVPDNLKKTETLYFAGAKILLYPPPYEIGQQRLVSLPGS